MTTRGDRRGLLRRVTLERGALPYTLAAYPVFRLPNPALWTGAHVYIPDEASGGVEAFSDGVYWRRVTDQSVVSAVYSSALSCSGASSATLDGVAGPYLVSTGAATGIFSTAAFAASCLSADGVSVGSLGTPPKEPTDLNADSVALGTLAGASFAGSDLDVDSITDATLAAAAFAASGLSATGAATATFYGAAA